MTKYTELTTIRDYIRFATSHFNQAGLYFGHGTTNAWDEAVALVLHTLHLTHQVDQMILDAHLTAAEKQTLDELIDQRIKKRIPLAYLTHEAWFANLPFYVDERVLIPRSSIGELIQKEFQPWVATEQVHHILDLCTGSGCIAIACAKAFPDAQVDASDISEEALAVAKINVVRHAVNQQVKLIRADLFDGIPKKKYDLIISNPPYVDAAELSALPDEYRHEPRLGLAAGEDGLDSVVKILQQAPSYLSPHGFLIVEVGNSETALIEAFPQIPFTWISFEESEGGVFILSAAELKELNLARINSEEP